ncbi:hypothetical protein NEDG_01911 [Nematocida displodere]|uniref:Plasma membrane proteolipid 3 n=1 Tax=Nematocida displodere TaxID=1805483 RepID=A0A177EGQ6_9MICR|nr:hypothetical protein NEDG_01911 [Nematocida displodere]
MLILHILLAIMLPPISVFIFTGFSIELLVNVLLSCCFILPGSIHALFILNRSRSGASKSTP